MADILKVKAWLESLVSRGAPEDLQRLFAEELNFHPASGDIVSVLSDKLKENVSVLRIIAKQDEFYIILCSLATLFKGKERPIAEKISEYYPHSLVVFTNPEYSEWHFTNIKHVKLEKQELERRVRPFRRLIVGNTERLRTASERLALLEVADDDSAIAVHERCNRAFNVQEVSREFYKDFVHYYKEFRDIIKRKNRLADDVADTFTQNIFNRLFFLYFIQKKNFLSENPMYLYDNLKNCKGEYYKDFLLPLFKKLSEPEFKDKRFEKIPFLNGGLFEFDLFEDKVTIPNDAFKAVFEDLLERYNFTVREDTEFEQEVAIDPEMLGTIFEQLILGLEKAEYKDIPDARRGTGSYYTPKFTVAFMVKESLLNYLAGAYPDKRNKLKELVFSLKTDSFNVAELKEIRKTLLDVKAVDPSVGSGAYAVGLLLKMVEIVEALDKAVVFEDVAKPDYRYRLKRNIIENNIYGVDIQRRAVNLANLRLWLSLIVDLNVKSIKDIPPLPNLDYHIIMGDSLISRIGEFSFDVERTVRLDLGVGTQLLDRLIKLKKEYESIPTREKKEAHRNKIEKTKKDILLWFLKKLLKRKEDDLKLISPDKLWEEETIFTSIEQRQRAKLNQEIETIKKHINDVDNLLETFTWGLEFFDVIMLREGFDIVFGNPPYGIKVSDSVKNEFELGNKDSYGVFTALGLKILRPGGTLCYIMSDTWQTIKTHKPLRDRLLSEADCQYLISCPSDTFGATVNVGVYSFKKRLIPKEVGENWILAADFSPLSIEKGELEAAFEMLIEQDNFDDTKDGYTIWSDRDMSIFAYRQKLIPRFSNHSFFIASPKLFGLMKDTGNIKNELRREDEPPVYSVEFNGKELELLKLGSVAGVRHGMTTGDTKKYIFKIAEDCRGSFEIADPKKMLNEEDILKFSDEEKQEGIDEKKYKNKYLVPYDKGESSESEDGWLPNYFVKTGYFLDWRRSSVNAMKELPGHRHDNPTFYFIPGITYSITGIYAPTFRINARSIFDVKSSNIFSSWSSYSSLLGLFCSLLSKYLWKNFVCHTVDTSVDVIKELPVESILPNRTVIGQLVNQLVTKQKTDPRYDYMTNEQVEIDRLVYQMYNLDNDDIKEVENWFFRRYPKLAKVIEEKMKGRGIQ
ncbi:MAG: Eco57I restriction-modification methylase domain-containing protein [Thermodesulfovibrionales bacterium]|nr:Eco57I restriction-modification methylase domain-containing protein [Thermodesulfovibrionales bacterium]